MGLPFSGHEKEGRERLYTRNSLVTTCGVAEASHKYSPHGMSLDESLSVSQYHFGISPEKKQDTKGTCMSFTGYGRVYRVGPSLDVQLDKL
jgi:hypothetical protein